jgi:hypothetical protein
MKRHGSTRVPRIERLLTFAISGVAAALSRAEPPKLLAPLAQAAKVAADGVRVSAAVSQRSAVGGSGGRAPSWPHGNVVGGACMSVWVVAPLPLAHVGHEG